MAETEITELVDLNATRIDGVGSPANGTPWLMLKATADDDTVACKLCDGSGKIRAGHVTCPDCNGDGKVTPAKAAAQKSSSKEADMIEELVTGEAAKSLGGYFCGDPTCSACRTAVKADLSSSERNSMPNSKFAYVDPKGGKHLPIHDESHVRAALSRFNQTDFSGADDPDKAKGAAAGKIKSAAGDHNIDVSDDSAVAQAAKGMVQDSLNGQNGDDITKPVTDLISGQSGLAGPMVTTTMADPTAANGAPGSGMNLRGGQSPYTIPAESHMVMPAFKAAMAGSATTRLHAAIDALEKDGGTGTLTPPSGTAATDPSSAPWESYDSATLGQVAGLLAMCNAAIDAIFKREQTEAMTGDSSDRFDAWDLLGAQDALDFATGIVARLTFVEQAASMEASKTTNFEPLISARDQLTALIEAGETAVKAQKGSTPSEEDTMAIEVTKEELAEAIAAGSNAAVKAELDTFKDDLLEAIKNANNNGENSTGDLKINGDIDDKLKPVSGATPGSQFANKETAEQEQGLADLVKSAVQEAVAPKLNELETQLAKMGKRATQGGPILDGQFRPGQAAKSETADEVQQLTKRLEETTDPIAKSRLSEDLTLAKLRAHASGQFGDFNPIQA